MIPFLPPEPARFPPTRLALREPDGLLAAGGALTPDWLLEAYRHGIFPWFSEGEPILWWSPAPRCVLRSENVRVRRSLRKNLKKPGWAVRFDQDFAAVIQACAETPRPGQDGTWITNEMIDAYITLHRLGYAHSVEVFWEGERVGGLYGVHIGRMFFGESMFSWKADASKIALVSLCRTLQPLGFELIDCQVPTDHLLSMGAELMPRETFEAHLQRLCAEPFMQHRWDTLESVR